MKKWFYKKAFNRKQYTGGASLNVLPRIIKESNFEKIYCFICFSFLIAKVTPKAMIPQNREHRLFKRFSV